MSTSSEVQLLIGAVVLLIGVAWWSYRRWLRVDDEWTVPAWQRPVPYDEYVTYVSADEWELLDPDLAAETLIAEWHDEGNETTAITGQMNVLDDLRLLAWDASRQVSMIKTLRAAYRQEMAWTLDWYRDALEHRRVA